MRIHRVTLTGFGPYKGTEVVDFDAFEADGLFLIAGKTGAGKTSILDGITYALYGRIPRYEDAAGEKVRSDHIGPADACLAALEFSTGGARYRVTRSPEYKRPKQRGGGFTTEATKAEIARWNGRDWDVLETQVRNVALRIDEILHMNASQFQQVILLAQGRFQEFLVANSDTRRELLRTLFGTKRFADYTDAVDLRAKELRTTLAAVISATKAYVASLAHETGRTVPESVDVDSGSGVIEWAQRLSAAEQAAVAEAEAEEKLYLSLLNSARDSFEQAKSCAERQQRRSRARQRQSELAAEADSVDRDQTRLERARRAEMAWPAVRRHGEAESHVGEALERQLATSEEFRAACPGIPEDLEALERAIVGFTETTGTLREHGETEKQLSRLEERLTRSSAALAEFDAESEALSAKILELRERLTDFQCELPDVSADAALLPDAKVRLDKLLERLVSATKAEQTAAELDTARLDNLDAGTHVTAASAARDALRARQLGGYAAVLAEGLTEGEPCPVCGSIGHPAPAEHGHDRVSDEQLRQAEAAYEAAVESAQKAGNRVSKLAERLTLEEEGAGHETPELLSEQIMLSRNEVDRLTESAEHLDRLQAEQRGCMTRLEECQTLIVSRQDQRATLATAQATDAVSLQNALAAVEQARAGYASVADRLSEVGSHLRLAKSLQQAMIAVEATAEQLAAAADELNSVLVDQHFDSAAEVVAARIPTQEQVALSERIQQHIAETTAIEALLASADLQGLPDDPVDVAGPETKYNAARSSHLTAVGRLSAAQQRASTIARLLTDLTQTLDSATELRERCRLVGQLAATLKGQPPNTKKMNLESFVLAAELEEIVRAANGRLRVMTSGRYEFQYSDALARAGAQSGLSLDILDAYTGEARSPRSLSGGEQFQASLALALGLAEVVSTRNGGIRLDTLFVDEGFGSLSDDTLETTMATLDSLREGGRIVGLISHVQSMKETIPAQLRVCVADGGWSTIER